MVNKFLLKLVDHQQEKSLSNRFRSSRFMLFKKLIGSIPVPIKILDAGGREEIWQKEGLCQQNKRDLDITIINLEQTPVHSPNVRVVVGNVTNMDNFNNQEFDVVFSNSVIEHVGEYQDQQRMAQEIKRVGKRYFIQTPNRYFPIEPHFLFPLFQFFPLWLKMLLITNFDLGNRPKTKDKKKAKKLVTSIRLLTKTEMMNLFPEAKIYEEKILGMTKSFVAYAGWD